MLRPIELTEANFNRQVLQAKGPVLVDFWAAWCAPCRAVGPIIERLAEVYSPNVRVGKLNIDEHSGPALKFEINSIPTVLLFQNGKVIESFIGVQSQETYAAALDRMLIDSPADVAQAFQTRRANKPGENDEFTNQDQTSVHA